MNLGEFKGLVLAAGINNLNENTLRAFINAGQRMLDRVSDFPHQQGKLSFTVHRGTYFLVFPSRLRIVHGVWMRTAQSGVADTPLDKTDLTTIRSLYPRPGEQTQWGTPIYYAHSTSILAGFGSPLVDEVEVPVDDVVVSTDDPFDYKGLFIAPTPDQTYYIEVLGTAYTKELVSDLDTSFWSKHYPDVLLNAVMFKLEGFFRNGESAKSYFDALMADVRHINYDNVEDEMQERPNFIGW